MNERHIAGKRFLITGGASLIGSHLTQALLARGVEGIIIYDNLSLGSEASAAVHLNDPRVTLVRGDVLDADNLARSCEGVEGIFALAAFLTLPFFANPAVGTKVNVLGSLNVLEAARQAGKAKVVFASSISTYGNDIHGLVGESNGFGSHGLSPAFASYASSKLMGEHLGRLYVQKHGIGFSSVRFSTVYGEHQHARGVNALYILEAMQKVSAGEAPVVSGDGSEAHDYVHASDAAAGLVAAMERGVDGDVYNVASGISTSVDEVIRAVLTEYGSSLKPQTAADKRATRSTAHTELLIDVTKARCELGYEPKVMLPEGVARLRRWLEAQPGAAD